MHEDSIKRRVKQELSAKRFAHTEGVVAAARALAEVHGVDVEKATVAALIHDVAREWPVDKQVMYAEKIEIPSGFGMIPVLLHGPIAASLAKEWFDVEDEDILNAIRYHTTGRIGMSSLEQVICLADAIEPGRSYDGVDEIRNLAKEDLNKALAVSLDSTLTYLIQRHAPIFPLTVMVRNELWESLKS